MRVGRLGAARRILDQHALHAFAGHVGKLLVVNDGDFRVTGGSVMRDGGAAEDGRQWLPP